MEIFNVLIEFNKNVVEQTINRSINTNKKGYDCIIDGNVLANANTNKAYNHIINSALINICDGSFIALLTNLIYKKKYHTFVGADLFIKLLEKNNYKFYFLGNTTKVLDGLRKRLSIIDSSIRNMVFEPLPFARVEEFDYESIANKINKDNPDIIWVSLGAPKQEEFMYRLQPFLKRGVMFGVGAVFNFYSDESDEKRAPKIIRKLKLEWVFRTIKNPQKQLPKAISFIKIIPKLYLNEKRKVKDIKQVINETDS